MKLLIQRVAKASVTINSKEMRSISKGLVVFAGFAAGDTTQMCKQYFDKLVNLRIFSNAEGKFDKSILDVSGELLIVSQFTLYGACQKGNRPDFKKAAGFNEGKKVYDEFVKLAQSSAVKTVTGEFGADMMVEISNDGPVTIIMDLGDKCASKN